MPEAAQAIPQTTPAAPPPEASVPASVPSAAAPSAGASIPTSAAMPAGSGGVTGTPAPAPDAQQYTDLLDIIRQTRPDLASRFTDGATAVQHLLAAEQQAQRWRQFEPHIGQYQQWRAEQERQAAAARAKADEWFKAPEFDPRWRDAVYRDAAGNLQAREGYAPDVVQKYLAAAQHQRDFLDKFSFDPVGAIRPGIEQVVKEVAGRLMEQNLGGYAEQTAANGFIEQNRSWLFDAQGQLTQYGHVFRDAVTRADRIGVKGVAQQQEFALQAVQNAYALERWNQVMGQQAGGQPAAPQAPVDPNAAATAAFLAAAQQRPQATAAPAAAHTAGQTVPTPQPAPSGGNHVHRIQQRMAQNARAQGLLNGAIGLPG